MKINIARGLAAQCWCDPRTSNREMDVELAEVFAETIQKLSNFDPSIVKMIKVLEIDNG